MARMTATDFVDFTRKAMGNPSTEEWSDNEILRCVNLAIVRVAMAHECPELETSTDVTTSDGTSEYELSVDDVLRITAAKNTTNGVRLKTTNRDNYTRSNQSTSDIQGAPVRYFESGEGSSGYKQVVLYPQPDDTYTITFWYIQVPTEIVLSPTATSPMIGQQWDETILQYAIEIAKNLDQQMQSAAAQRSMASDPEGRAAMQSPGPPERRWGVRSPVQPSTVRDRRRR